MVDFVIILLKWLGLDKDEVFKVVYYFKVVQMVIGCFIDVVIVLSQVEIIFEIVNMCQVCVEFEISGICVIDFLVFNKDVYCVMFF